MSREQQLYYALWIFLAAVAVLLSPFAYVRVRRRQAHRPAPWRRIILIYLAGAALSATVLYVWLA